MNVGTASRGVAETSDTSPRLGSTAVAGWGAALADINRDVSDGERIDQLRALEELKAQAAAAQAQIAADFADSQYDKQAAAGVPTAQRGRGVAAQIALARRDSPHKGARHLGLAKALLEMPYTRAALLAGVISEWRATLIVRDTVCLSFEHRQHVDRLIAADPTKLESLGDGALVAKVKKLAATLDPAAVVARNRRAVSERRVSCRPAPDTMCYLTALLPVAQGVAAYAALVRAADSAVAGGDGRGRGQLMADTLVKRLTGQIHADAVPVEVNIVISDQSLLAGGEEPASLNGYGPIPAQLARQLAGRAAADGIASLRRLYTREGALTALESRARCFPAGLARLVTIRDQICRTPWCDAPIRHVDHIQAREDDGPTTADNGQGLCEACNHAKQAPGWQARPVRAGPESRTTREAQHTVETITPTGHTYISTAPELPKAASPPGRALIPPDFYELSLGA